MVEVHNKTVIQRKQVTGQFADKPTRGPSSRWPVNSRNVWL